MKECDISKVETITELFETAPDQRGSAWKQQFYDAVIDASFACGDPQVINGPDGFPYFALKTPEPFKGFESFCLCNIVETATDNGFGAVINPSGQGANWVFSYGDLATLRMFNSFEAPKQETPDRDESLQQDQQFLIGSPSEEFLPAYVRAVLRSFLTEGVGIENPGVFLMSRASDSIQQLAFSVFPEDFETEDHFNDIMGRITWFLPRHYLVVSVSRESGFEDHFQPL
jgi:hypothetical protein